MTDQPGDLLARTFSEFEPKRVKVAFSGGADSTALLLECSRTFRGPLVAVHVNHGVHPDSGRWADHCRTVAGRLQAGFECHSLDRHKLPGRPNEAQLRDARYELLAAGMARGDLLLTAHHADDVAETVLLAALRGGSSHELAGIPRCRPLGFGTLCRPWLEVPGKLLREPLQAAALSWLEDPANESVEVRRSYLRQQVMPLLEQRWPDAAASLAATARRQTSTAAALDELLDLHLARHCSDPRCIAAATLEGLCPDTQLLLLQRWLVGQGIALPPARQLRELLRQRERCADDRLPRLSLADHSLRCYRRNLYLVASSAPPPPAAVSLTWHPRRQHALRLPDGSRLCWQGDPAPAELRVHLGDIGLRVQREGEQQHRQVNKLFQQLGIPPWARAGTPLIFQHDRLIQIGSAWRCRRLASLLSEHGQQLVWEPTAG